VTAEGEGFELEATRRRERSESLLPKSRAQPRDLQPLDRLTGGVQYRLETPSNATYHAKIIFCTSCKTS